MKLKDTLHLLKPILENVFFFFFMISTYLSCQSCFPSNYFGCSIFNEIILLLSKAVLLLLVRYFHWSVFCSRSQASVDPGREGHGPCHRGETILGVPGQWEAQTLLHVAEERPTATLRGKLQPVLCHLPIFHFKDLISSSSSSFHFRELGIKHIALFPSTI